MIRIGLGGNMRISDSIENRRTFVPTLQEIMAAKAAAKKTNSTTITSDTSTTATEEASIAKEEPVVEEKKEVAVAQLPKPMTFAEKMALKKNQSIVQDAAAQTGLPPAIVTSTTSGIITIPETKKEETKIIPEEDHSELIKATLPAVTQAPAPDHSDEDAQAYADIKDRIDKLTELAGEPLENAMSDLKKALLKNPNATNLMQDQDIGQLVIALRKITGEAIAEAAKDGRKTKVKAKQNIDLTDAAVVAAIMDEL